MLIDDKMGTFSVEVRPVILFSFLSNASTCIYDDVDKPFFLNWNYINKTKEN